MSIAWGYESVDGSLFHAVLCIKEEGKTDVFPYFSLSDRWANLRNVADMKHNVPKFILDNFRFECYFKSTIA